MDETLQAEEEMMGTSSERKWGMRPDIKRR